mmetsp:Transcript_23796/g.38550  ORF Transcript_23796/g.38550 Transcript_23796/m.38550 type:complete len:101 (-) Transcript_23796:1333-1635(-)
MEYFILNKPEDVLSSKKDGRKEAEAKRTTVYDLALAKGFPAEVGLVGRLDFKTTGLIMFTSDPRLSSAITNKRQVISYTVIKASSGFFFLCFFSYLALLC